MNILLFYASSSQANIYEDLLAENNIKLNQYGTSPFSCKNLTHYDALLFAKIPTEEDCDEITKVIENSHFNSPLIFIGSPSIEIVKLNRHLSKCIFLQKRFATHEIIQLIKEILIKSNTRREASHLSLRGITLNRSQWTVTIKGGRAQLTRKEFHILELFMINEGAVISKTQIANIIWDKRIYVSNNTIEVYVCRLRKKLRNLEDKAWIQTIPCIGYEFKI